MVLPGNVTKCLPVLRELDFSLCFPNHPCSACLGYQYRHWDPAGHSCSMFVPPPPRLLHTSSRFIGVRVLNGEPVFCFVSEGPTPPPPNLWITYQFRHSRKNLHLVCVFLFRSGFFRFRVVSYVVPSPNFRSFTFYVVYPPGPCVTTRVFRRLCRTARDCISRQTTPSR